MKSKSPRLILSKRAKRLFQAFCASLAEEQKSLSRMLKDPDQPPTELEHQQAVLGALERLHHLLTQAMSVYLNLYQTYGNKYKHHPRKRGSTATHGRRSGKN